MSQMKTIAVAVATAVAMMAGAVHAAQGPSSSETPYLTPVAAGWDFTSIITTGDTVGGYKMSGIPDGLGAYDNGNGTLTVLMNHELNNAQGVTRAHGGAGAFVSEWIVNKNTLQVTSGADLMQRVYSNSGSGWSSVSGATFARFCSSDLPATTALYNSSSGLGTQSRIYITGEENGNGRGVAVVATGTDKGSAYVLPWATNVNAGWENLLANPYSGDKTLVIGNADGGTNGLYVYAGNKTNTGNDIEKAGLVGGQVYRVSINSNAVENRNADANFGLVNGSGNFSLVAGTATGTSFLRPEDGAWDTKNPNKYYFVTTDRMDAAKDGNVNPDNPVGQVGRSRLWSLTFTDLAHPENGGKVDLLLDGTEAHQMLDNITVDKDGKLLMQEDVGNNQHNGKIWWFDPITKQMVLIAKHDVARFGDIGITGSITKDEESSGVIDITALVTDASWYQAGRKYYLLDTQNHKASLDPALVEGGQLMIISAPVPEPSTYALMGAGLGLIAFVARRRKKQ